MQIYLSRSRDVVIALVLTLLLAGATVWAQKPHRLARAGHKPSIVITNAPNVAPGETSFGDISGVVKNAPTGSKLVIYSLGDTWYVQPFASAPFTEIGKDGKWFASIHGGYQYAVLLVSATYNAPPATTDHLPKIGRGILGIAHAKPSK